MNYHKKTVRDVDVKGKKVLLRCDFNVPQDKETGAITSDKRIVAALPTIRYLLENGAAVIACSHLGKPKNGPDPKLSLAPVAKRLSELLGQEVIFAHDVVGEDAQAKAAALQPGQILLLENTRFEPGETKNDPELAKKLASLADLYVSDAFGAVHRAHASTAGVAAYLPAVSGFLIQKELEFLGGAIADPKRPLVAILGGSKVSSKIGVINNLLNIADTIIIGGGMAYTFSAAQGGKVGDSLLEADWESYANEMVQKAREKGVKLLLPVDTVCADAFAPDARSQVVKAGEIPDGWQGLDIGPETVKLYCDAVADAGTVIWNGPMGVFEFPAFAKGTEAVAEALSQDQRHHHHRRRRQRGGRGAAGLCRQDDPHLHRRRRQPGVPGGQGAARRGLPAGQVKRGLRPLCAPADLWPASGIPPHRLKTNCTSSASACGESEHRSVCFSFPRKDSAFAGAPKRALACAAKRHESMNFRQAHVLPKMIEISRGRWRRPWGNAAYLT